MKIIKYQLWIDGFLDELDRKVCFLFCIPYIYKTYEEAENDCNYFYVKPRKTKIGEVVFDIYKKSEKFNNINPIYKDIIIDTIHWNEYWKYECQIIKETGIENSLAEIFPETTKEIGDLANFPCITKTDFEPYADKFEEMYNKYLDTKKYTFEKICNYAVQSTSYVVKPIIV